MRKLMWKYLDMKYPNAFLKKSKFGSLGVCNDEPIIAFTVVRQMSHLFSCSVDETTATYHDWIHSRPILTNLPNSTNPDVLIGISYESNKTSL